MSKAVLASYNIIILDNIEGPDSWGNLTKLDLLDKGYRATHVYDVDTALRYIEKEYFDLFIIDLNLGGDVDGIKFQEHIRDLNYMQPILFVSGNQDFLELPIHRYANAFARGPVVFFDKTTDDFDNTVDEAINRIDPIHRSLNIMKNSGLGETEFTIRDQKYTVNELLIPSRANYSIIRSLKESFQGLLLEQLLKKEE